MSPAAMSAAAVGARVVIIVARERPELFEYFRAAFAGIDGVDIIVDRRLPCPGERHPLDTDAISPRWQPDVYDNLMLRGFIITRLS